MPFPQRRLMAVMCGIVGTGLLVLTGGELPPCAPEARFNIFPANSEFVHHDLVIFEPVKYSTIFNSMDIQRLLAQQENLEQVNPTIHTLWSSGFSWYSLSLLAVYMVSAFGSTSLF